MGLILNSINAFLSWLFLEFWIWYTFKFFQKIRYYREFNSPHNTSFFVLSPFLIGMFYSFWAYYAKTGLFEQNLLEDSDLSLFLSPWNLFFALPYLLYSLHSINSCFRKFDIVYLINNKYVKARPFAFVFITFFIIFGLSIIIIIRNYYELIPLEAIHFYLDFSLLISIILAGLMLLVHGLVLRRPSLPEITPSLIAERRRRVENIRTPPARSTIGSQRSTPTRAISRPQSRTTTRSSSSRIPSQHSRATPSVRTARTTTSSKTKTQTPSNIIVPSTRTQTVEAKKNYEQYRPKGAILTAEDFKCIFCFKLPEISGDQNRGIILCPNCKHPAHADEFKNWLKSSNLCSRCNSPIPLQFRNNPQIIPVKEYLKIVQEFNKK